MPRESVFEAGIIRELEEEYPGAVILKNDASLIQGIPDRIILFGRNWAAFEAKASWDSNYRPNQEYWVRVLNDMSYASFVYPQNQKRFFDEIQYALRLNR